VNEVVREGKSDRQESVRKNLGMGEVVEPFHEKQRAQKEMEAQQLVKTLCEIGDSNPNQIRLGR
jgi:hypothetical protein